MPANARPTAAAKALARPGKARGSYLLDGHTEGYDIGGEKSLDIDSDLDFALVELLLRKRLESMEAKP